MFSVIYVKGSKIFYSLIYLQKLTWVHPLHWRYHSPFWTTQTRPRLQRTPLQRPQGRPEFYTEGFRRGCGTPTTPRGLLWRGPVFPGPRRPCRRRRTDRVLIAGTGWSWRWDRNRRARRTAGVPILAKGQRRHLREQMCYEIAYSARPEIPKMSAPNLDIIEIYATGFLSLLLHIEACQNIQGVSWKH